MVSLDANAVIDRMCEVVGVTTDTALVHLLAVGSSTVSTWRRRNTVPFEVCVDIALRNGVSLDWMLLGDAARKEASGVVEPAAITCEDPRILRMARFLRAWQVGHDADDIAWLERTLARSVPEYAEWLAANKP